MQKKIKTILGLLEFFVALTAIGGGVAMLTGADKFPLEWLEGTPFKNYAIPALVLALIVGSSSLLAAILIFTNHKFCAMTSMTAGVILTGQIVVEILILKQTPPGPTAIEAFYFVVGFIMVGLSAYLRKMEYRPGIVLQ